MRKRICKILVTGGAGFIGSEFVRQAVMKGYRVIVLDKLSYAGDLKRLADIRGRYVFYKIDICNEAKIQRVFNKEKPEIIVNFAAETHVDRSIRQCSSFIEANVRGTQVLLEASRKHKVKKFLQISTDEVYGEITRGSFREDSPLKPNSPYAATKASADLLIGSYVRTYGFPALIARPCNNYGPWQYPEKLIPLSILKILRNEKIPVYGRGKNSREWIFVADAAEGLLKIMEKGRPGEIYNLGSRQELRNKDVVRKILKTLKKEEGLISFVKDRPGHDLRYCLNSRKVIRGFNWRPKMNFEEGLRITVSWYLKHKKWLLSKWQSISPLYTN